MSLFAASMMITSCGDELTDKNINPNEPSEVPASALLTQAQYGLSENYWGRPLNFGFGMLMVQHFAETEYTDASRYNFIINDFDGPFSGFYSSNDGSLVEIATARDIIEATEFDDAAQKTNQLAVLNIMKAWAFHVAVDIWGDLPYTQANNPDEFITPSYDDGREIYVDLISLLTQASDDISTGSPGFLSGDVIYNGDMAMWKKFANSLKVKLAMRIADVDASTAGTAISSAMAAGVFESNADNALFAFEANATLGNPFWIDNSINIRDDFAVSSFLVDHLKANNDPRLERYAQPNEDGEFIGLTYGLIDNDATQAQAGKSRPNTDYVRSADLPARLFTYSELKFFEAEAIDRGLISSGTAAAAYEAAIRASMAEWNVTDEAAIDAYIAAHPISSYSSVKEAVGMQKWVSLYTNGLEAWSEWRRLDVPSLELPDVEAGQLFNNFIPTRGLYPLSETIRNEENVNAAGSNQLNDKIFWDMN